MMIPYVAWEAFSAIANRLDLHIITRISAVARNQVGGSICERMSVLAVDHKVNFLFHFKYVSSSNNIIFSMNLSVRFIIFDSSYFSD